MMPRPAEVRDVFLCHASEDKESIVDPLFESLNHHNISCWYDRAEIRWGDSITQKVNEGLQISKYVIVVLSMGFLDKPWPQRELHAALHLEASSGVIKVLPLICGSIEERKYILGKLPLLNDKLFLIWDGNPQDLLPQLLTRLGKIEEPGYNSSRSQLATLNRVSDELSTVDRHEVLESTAIIYRVGESYLRTSYWFLIFGLAGIFGAGFAISLFPSNKAAYLWLAGQILCVVTGIQLHIIGDLYKEAHVRYTHTSTPYKKSPFLLPFTKKWYEIWSDNKRCPELQKAMILWVTSLFSGTIMIILFLLALPFLP